MDGCNNMRSSGGVDVTCRMISIVLESLCALILKCRPEVHVFESGGHSIKCIQLSFI